MGFVSHRAEVMSSLNNAARRALEVVGSVAEGFAKDACPTKTGTLKRSITHKVLDERTAIIGTNIKYAPAVELGHHQEPGRYVPAIGKRLKRSFVPGKPFLRPAAENHAPLYKEIFERELSNG